MSKNVVEELNELNELSKLDDECCGLLNYTLPSDEVLMMYQDKVGIPFNEETKLYFKNFPSLAYGYNAIEPLLLTGDPDCYWDLLRAVRDGREMGLPTDWLPIVEDNADYYAVRPDGRVAFWSHNGTTDEEWENIASWIREVWINGN